MEPAGLIASLEQQLRNAKSIPLTDQVRLDKSQMYATLEEMRTGFSRAGLARTLPLVDELERQLQGARPLPLTNDVRLERRDVQDTLERMRASVAPTTN